jgi:secondary thiamine-phosphate synthase enzyme
METLAHTFTCRHSAVRTETEHPTQFVDLTDRITQIVSDAHIHDGLVNIQALHTTTALVINEHDPLLLSDVAVLLERLAPQDGFYQHDNVGLRNSNCILADRANGHSHCRAVLLAPSVTVNVVECRLQLGTWQRIFLVELDGPRSRAVSISVMGEARR